ncbi:MAG: hypothetical protein WDW38_000374 [Sanguina aurantia]
MAYNLYQVQAARAWAERIDKEQAQAEKFWMQQALKLQQATANNALSDTASMVTSVAPSGYTSKTSYLNSRLDRLESELAAERIRRGRVERELAALKTGAPLLNSPTLGSTTTKSTAPTPRSR